MSDFGNRLAEFLKKKNISQKELAEQLGISKLTINRYIQNKMTPSIEFINILKEKYADLNSNWLITGEGSIDFVYDIPDIKAAAAFMSIYKQFSQKNETQKLNNLLYDLQLNDSLEAVYKNINTEAGFWKKIFEGNRYQIVSLIILQSALEEFTVRSNKINVDNSKNILIDLISDYRLQLKDKALHFVQEYEKDLILEYINEISDIDAYIILSNANNIRTVIKEHLKKLRTWK